MEEVLAIYVTARKVLSDLQDRQGRDRAASLIRAAGFQRVVLEGFRGGLVVEESALRAVRDDFEANGLETMGGLMPVHGGTFGKKGEGVETRCGFFCYSDAPTVEALEEEVRKLARLFDEVVVDDALLTSCRCARCREERGNRDWGTFRRELMCGVARSWVHAAHAENPKTRLIVKFPQYYDRYPLFGYDAERIPKIVDAVWQGTETRDPETLAYGYTQPYQGYFNARWMEACAGAKFEGAWFDTLACDEQQFYHQSVTTHLAAPDQITLFSYSEKLLAHSMTARQTEALPGLRHLRACAVEPWGVSVIKPPNANGEGDLFLYDDLGMVGIPCVPATELLPSMQSAIIPSRGIEDANVLETIPRALMSGGTIIVTLNALARMTEAPEILEFFGYAPEGVERGGGWVAAFEIDGHVVKTSEPFQTAGDLAPKDAAVLATALCEACEVGPLRVPFVTAKSYAGGGRAVVWNLGTFGHDAFGLQERLNVPVKSPLLELPKEVIDLLRRTATAPLGFEVMAPARVGFFLFAGHACWVNYGAAPAEVEFKGLGIVPESLFSDSAKTATTEKTLLLAPGSYALVERA